MKLTHNKMGTGGESRRNAAEEQQESPEKRRSKFTKILNEGIAAVKRTGRVIGFAVGMTVMAVACGGTPKATGDADAYDDAPADTSDTGTDSDVPDGPDGTTCSNSYDELPGGVNPDLAKTSNTPVHFNGPEGESVDGTAQVTMSGDMEGIVDLGECPDEPGTRVAFAGNSVILTPSWRIDVPDGSGQFNDVGDDSCSSPPEAPPISMLNAEANITAIPAIIGSMSGTAEVGFSEPIVASVIDVDSGETLEMPIPIPGMLPAVRSVAVVSGSTTKVGANVLSEDGEELSSSELQGNIGANNSKTIKLIKTESIVPSDIIWEDGPGAYSSFYVCLRPPSTETPTTRVEDAVEISAEEVLGAVSDSCGEKIFASFIIKDISAEYNTERYYEGVDPFYFKNRFSIENDLHNGEGLEAMDTENMPKLRIVMKGSSNDLDLGEAVYIDLFVTFTIESVEENPSNGTKDSWTVTVPVSLIMPEANDSPTGFRNICGYSPALGGF